MKAIDAVRECWDAEKRDWKDGWRLRRNGVATKICPGAICPVRFVDGSEWEVVRPPLADDEIELGGRRRKVRMSSPDENYSAETVHAPALGEPALIVDHGGEGFAPYTRTELVDLAETRPDPNGWPRALAYFDKHAPPQKVTLRKAMVALLKGEASSAYVSSLCPVKLGREGFYIDIDGRLEPFRTQTTWLRILAGIDPDDGPAEWELVR